jgi:tRNA-specific 2-thiouridylase
VRAHAERLKLHVTQKPDSQEICFVPDGDYASFVERKAPEAARPGTVVDNDGRVLGTHAGVHRFTIGQRKGLGLSSSSRSTCWPSSPSPRRWSSARATISVERR